MRLTDKCLKNARPTTKTLKLFDGGGLYLEIKPTGGKLWRLKYRFAGKEKRLSIGSYPLISLKEARERRDKAKKLLEQNIDPSQAKYEAKHQAIVNSGITFEMVAKEWHETMKDKWTADHAKSIMTRIETHLFPRIGRLPIRTIAAPTLLAVLKQVERAGIYETTKRVRQYASQIFKYAMITGRAERDITAGMSIVFRPAKVKHHAALDISEIPEFLEKLNRNEARLFIQTRYAIELMLLTFVRTSELLEAKWSEFDLPNKIWHIPAERMKMKQAHIVPLSTQVLNILIQLKSVNEQWEHILPSPISARKPMSENTILYALYRMGYRGKATGHGFRALAMTAIKEQLGYRHEVVDRQLAHAHRSKVDAAYDRAQFLEDRKKMMQEWADYIDGLKGVKSERFAA